MRYVDIDIDTKGLEDAIDKLEKLRKTALPTIARGTMNDVVFDMKDGKGREGTMTKQAREGFESTRNKTFVKSRTGVEKVNGNQKEISSMRAKAGVIKKDDASEGLSKQNFGDPIRHKMTPLDNARQSKTRSKRIAPRFKHDKRNSIDLRNATGRDFIAGAAYALAQKRTVVVKGKRYKGRKHVFVGRPVSSDLYSFSNLNTRKTYNNRKINIQWLYKENENDMAVLKQATPFVLLAARESAAKTQIYFNARFERYLSKVGK